MELAMKMDELNMEPRELTISELEEVSAGIWMIALGIGIWSVGFVAGFAFGRWLAQR
jgi:lactobin A/cerein 7B family class IIb bacteriocin